MCSVASSLVSRRKSARVLLAVAMGDSATAWLIEVRTAAACSRGGCSPVMSARVSRALARAELPEGIAPS